MLRKTFVEIDLAAVRWNLAQYKAALPVGGELMAVVKADGYGHGALEIAQVAVKAAPGLMRIVREEPRLEDDVSSREFVG